MIRLLQKHDLSQIQLTGHSLGAVFATYVAVDIMSQVNHYDYDDFLKNPDQYNITLNHLDQCYTIRHHLRIDGIYTFGMPRIGNEQLAAYIMQRIRWH